MVKISELALPSVRKVIPFYDADGNESTITIYNLTKETREFLSKLMEENTDEDGQLIIEPADMLIKVFPMLTDLEIDVDYIDEIITNPSKEMILINSEILSIINEINLDIVMSQNLEYERLLLLYEQMRGINMVAFLRERMERVGVLNDFDPLDATSKDERNERELREMRESYEKVKRIYEETVRDESQTDVDG